MTKIISLTNEVYMKLKKLKKNRSFSQEINELIEKSSRKGDVKTLRNFLGAWTKEEAATVQKEIAAGRKNAKPRVFS
jgi:predicted CopG family antitoxin